MVVFSTNLCSRFVTKVVSKVKRGLWRKISVENWRKFIESYLYSSICVFNHIVFIGLYKCFCSRV